MTQMTQIYADLNLCHPRHLCAKLFLTHPFAKDAKPLRPLRSPCALCGKKTPLCGEKTVKLFRDNSFASIAVKKHRNAVKPHKLSPCCKMLPKLEQLILFDVPNAALISRKNLESLIKNLKSFVKNLESFNENLESFDEKLESLPANSSLSTKNRSLFPKNASLFPKNTSLFPKNRSLLMKNTSFFEAL
jgi:hypothetical protein